jgi:hypothetical protein
MKTWFTYPPLFRIEPRGSSAKYIRDLGIAPIGEFAGPSPSATVSYRWRLVFSRMRAVSMPPPLSKLMFVAVSHWDWFEQWGSVNPPESNMLAGLV